MTPRKRRGPHFFGGGSLTFMIQNLNLSRLTPIYLMGSECKATSRNGGGGSNGPSRRSVEGDEAPMGHEKSCTLPVDKPAKSTWGICTRRAGKLNRACSQLYQSQILQANMRWKALAEIYTMHSFAPLSNLKIFVKNC